jgi:hypothetical protein
MHYHVVVIAHHGVGANINGKDIAQKTQAIHDPLPSMLETLPGMFVLTTQECPPHTTGDAVVIGRIDERNLLAAGLGHAILHDQHKYWLYEQYSQIELEARGLWVS